MTTDELSTIRGQVLDKVPVTLWGKIIDQMLLREELTGWGLVNAATRVLWHAEKRRRRTSRTTKSIMSALMGYGGLEERAHEVAA